MNGLDNIRAKITEDAAAEADGILREAERQASEIAASWEHRAEEEKNALIAKGQVDAKEQEDRILRVAELDGRKARLNAKQAMLERAFDRALEMMISFDDEKKETLLVLMCVAGSETGREEVIFSSDDAPRFAERTVARANEELASQGREHALRVSGETRPLIGGVILAEEGVEINCSYDTLLRLARPKLESGVAEILFS